MLPFFLERAREWRAVADALRARGVSDDDPALWVWREAAWCHLLFTRGRHDLIVVRLKTVFCELSGAPTAPTPRGLRAAELLACTVDLFEWLRAAVSVRHPYLCQPATRYYQIMTRADWMPALVGEVI